MVTTAVSSAKVSVVDSGEGGRSAVYSRYNNGPRILSSCGGGLEYLHRRPCE
jgi:hypothetical protein